MSEELPQGWAVAKLSELTTFNPKHSPDLPDDTPVTFVPMAAVSESSPDVDTGVTRPLGAVRKGYTHFANGDVLFAKITPCMENGKGGVASRLKNGIGCGTTELVVLRPGGAVHPHFLYRFLAQPDVRRAAKENFTGTAGQARVPTSFLENLGIPLAPIAEQRRIVAKLEKLLAKVDACQQRLAKIPFLLKRFRQSVLAAACSGRLTADWRKEGASGLYPIEAPEEGLPSLPKSWAYRKTSELVDPATVITYGIVLPGPNQVSGVPYIRGQDINDCGEILTNQLWRTTPAIAAKHKRSELKKGDVLLCVIRHLRVAIVGDGLDGANLTQGTVRLRPSSEILGPFLARYLEGITAQNWMKARYVGMAMPRINVEHARAIPIPLPPLPEQHEIVRRIEALFAFADRIEARFEQAQAQIDRLTPALLAKAFRGELVPQDPTDEPASVLRERLRSERETGTVKQRSRRRPAQAAAVR